jgi:hypothetical protein
MCNKKLELFSAMVEHDIFDKLNIFIKSNRLLMSSQDAKNKSEEIFQNFNDKLCNDNETQNIIDNNYIYILHNEIKRIPDITYDSDHKDIPCDIIIKIGMNGIVINIEEK